MRIQQFFLKIISVFLLSTLLFANSPTKNVWTPIIVDEGLTIFVPNKDGSHISQVTNVLFAHGFLGSEETWDHFTESTSTYTKRKWTIYKTSVSETGSIEERGNELADYINAQDIADNSMLVVGHSMGGLDLQYIISKGNQDQSNANKFYRAAKTIHKLYTLASPHKGSDIAALVPQDDGAVHDLSTENMEKFNEENPYSGFNIDGRNIPMLAFRFYCKTLTSDDDDGIVEIEKQILDYAPYTKEIFKGKHTTGNLILCTDDSVAEVLQTPILHGILDNTEYETEVSY